MSKPDFHNPMNFRCAPNETDPHYAREHDFKRFVAFGMLQSANQLVGDGTDAIMATQEDVYYLRKQFLDELENALTALPDMKEEAAEMVEAEHKGLTVYYQGDHVDGPLVPFEIDERNPEDTAQVFEWHFDRYDFGDVCSLLFCLTWGSPDTFSIWLAEEAIAAAAPPPAPFKTLRDTYVDIIEEARKANEAIGKHEE